MEGPSLSRPGLGILDFISVASTIVRFRWPLCESVRVRVNACIKFTASLQCFRCLPSVGYSVHRPAFRATPSVAFHIAKLIKPQAQSLLSQWQDGIFFLITQSAEHRFFFWRRGGEKVSRLHETSFRILRVNLEAVKTKAKMRIGGGGGEKESPFCFG